MNCFSIPIKETPQRTLSWRAYRGGVGSNPPSPRNPGQAAAGTARGGGKAGEEGVTQHVAFHGLQAPQNNDFF